MSKSSPLLPRFLLFFLLLFFLFSNLAQAGQLGFAWSPNSDSNLAGYKIYYGTGSRNYTVSIDVGNPAIIDGKVTYTVPDLPEGTTLYFAATAYDSNGFESDYSAEVVCTCPTSIYQPASVDTPAIASDSEAVFSFITDGFPQEEISAIEEASLLKVWEDQKLSRDLYQEYSTTLDSQFFLNMLGDAEHHMDFVNILLQKYGIPFPQDVTGSFTDQDHQNLYNLMLVQGNDTTEEGLRLGATAEDMIIDELQNHLSQTVTLKVRIIYQNLLRSARNHLRLFVNELSQEGITYIPQYISGDDFDSIMVSPIERSIYDENGGILFENGEWILTATPNGPNRIDLTWTAPNSFLDAATLDVSSNEKVFRIARSMNNGTYLFLANTPADVVCYSDTTVIDGNTYQYRVFTVNTPIADSIGVFRAGAWLLDSNGNNRWDGKLVDVLLSFGLLTGDKPVVGDWNGDGITEIGVFRKGVWYLDMNGNGIWGGEPADKICYFGRSVDGTPVTGDWNNDGITEIGVFSNNTGIWYLDTNGNCKWDVGSDLVTAFGKAGDVPVVGNWTGVGPDKIGVYRAGIWLLDTNGNGEWDGEATDSRMANFSIEVGDVPVTGNWNGNGPDKIGVFRAGSWILDTNGNGIWDGTSMDTQVTFGKATDVPIPNKW